MLAASPGAIFKMFKVIVDTVYDTTRATLVGDFAAAGDGRLTPNGTCANLRSAGGATLHTPRPSG
ncbi:MAG: hypothetical protein ABI442_06870 [Gemmatimonadaceae bacterium]